MSNRHEAWELAQYQALPLDAKIRMSLNRIRQWYEHFNGNVVVSFSGGKDSTVLLHLVRSIYPDVPAVFSDTGLEYPELRRFAMSQENINVVRPKMRFPEGIRTYGYPIISKEVAEAIYYSRRIGGGERHKGNNESSMETGSSRTKGSTLQTDRASGTKNHLIETSIARNRRTVLHGQMSAGGVRTCRHLAEQIQANHAPRKALRSRGDRRQTVTV